MSKDEKILCYDEPHFSGGNCHVTLTKKQAIKVMKTNHPDRYPDDEAALDDFIVIHWAWWKEND